jgi:xanthine dehydrogenase YagS FAD-binding subunit
MRPFEYVRAADLSEALRLLDRPGTRVMAGGTTLVDLMKLGVEVPDTVVDIGALPLAEIVIEDGAMRIGALVSNAVAAAHAGLHRHAPALGAAIVSGASGQIRNAATMGGNLLQRTRCSYFRSTDWPCNKREPGSGCAARTGLNANHALLGSSEDCMAVNPSDLAVALLAADARLVLRSVRAERVVPLASFYRLPGTTPQIETALAPGELITRIDIPLTPLNASGRYLKLRGRASYEFASASVASSVILSAGIVQQVAVAIGGLGVRPWRDRDVERELLGRPLEMPAIGRFCDVLLSAATPLSANRHKLSLARGAILRALTRDAACQA